MRLLFVASALAVMAGIAGYFLLQSTPRTPEEMFNVRCSTCHDLPDLEGYTTRERRGIVMTMLTEKGADKVITPDEAREIIGYITGTDASVSQKDQGNGDT